MRIQKWLELNAKQKSIPSPFEGAEDMLVWVTKGREDYITLVGMEDKSYIQQLAKYNLTSVQSSWEAGKPINIGFSEDEQKWYGWSHRAIYGFGIGSEVRKGDCGYQPKDPDDFLTSKLSFWQDDEFHHTTDAKHVEENGVKGVLVTWIYNNDVPNAELREKINSIFTPYPEKFGRGEWVAETLDDAKQMAIDFAEGVS